jgi:hypothetical protein
VAGGAQRFVRQEPDGALAAATGFLDALALDGLKEGLLYRPVDIPKAEIIFVEGGHFEHFPFAAGGQSRPGISTRGHPRSGNGKYSFTNLLTCQ